MRLPLYAIIGVALLAAMPLPLYYLHAYAERVAPTDLPLSPAETRTFDASRQPPEYADFYKPCPNESCVSRLLVLWEKAVRSYFTNYTSAPRTAHTQTDVLLLFADRMLAWDDDSEEGQSLDIPAMLRPWYPPFLVNYTYMLAGRKGFGFENPFGGKGLIQRPKMFAYLTERAACRSSLEKLVVWLPYSWYVRSVEWLRPTLRKDDLEVFAGAAYWMFLTPGLTVVILAKACSAVMRGASVVVEELWS
jgi:hypothetical protein